MTQPWAQLKARRRQRARESGLCITCCKIAPQDGRVVCKTCSTRAVRRVIEGRHKKRKAAELQKTIDAHVDYARKAFYSDLYEEAAQHYQDALDIEIITPAEQSRIAVWLASALSYGSNPDGATPWLDRAIEFSLQNPDDAGRSVYLLLRKLRLLWTNFQTDAMLAVTVQMIQIATASGHSVLRALANYKMVQWLHLLGRFEEADQLLRSIESLDNVEDTATRVFYYCEKAIGAALTGKSSIALAYFEKAIGEGNEDDRYMFISLLSDYAEWSFAIGDIERAKSLGERALLLTRRHRITWYIPIACLQYAEILYTIGEYESAREYVFQALAHEASMSKTTPLHDATIVEVGVPLALHFADEAMLAKCIRPEVLEKSLCSGAPDVIGPVAAGFAEWHRSFEREHEARTLLHRAIGSVHRCVRTLRLPVAVARYGLVADIPKARALLEHRIATSSSPVAQAHLALFDAFVAKRKRRHNKAHVAALEAVQRFEALGWYGYADMARSILPEAVKPPVSERRITSASDIQRILSTRERQVAELAIKGLTNRNIASKLSISENTVESHMAAIMYQLGIRSRYQLEETLIKNTG